MNSESIEKLLRKSPPVTTPPDLLDDLQRTIALKRASTVASPGIERPSASGWLRRWIPALGFGVWFVACLVALGVQSSRIAELKERNRAMESQLTGNGAVAAPSATANNEAENDQIKKDLAEIDRLRDEIAQLRTALAELTQLQSENAQLRAALKARTAAQPPKPEEDFFAAQKERAGRIACINTIKQFCLAARVWANASKTDAMPPDTDSMKMELGGTDQWLFCPADHTTRLQLLSPGAPENQPNVVFVRCPVHNNVGLVDGSAHQLGSDRQVVKRDGLWVIEKQ